jgi:hypothetical protein
LDNLGKYYYDVPDEIIIIEPSETQSQSNNEGHGSSEYDSPNSTQKPNPDSMQTATDATDATHNREGKRLNELYIIQVHRFFLKNGRGMVYTYRRFI